MKHIYITLFSVLISSICFSQIYTETFESGSLPANIVVTNPDDDNAKWEFTTAASGFTGTGAIYIDNYNYDTENTSDYFTLPGVNLITNSSLSFDVAHARYDEEHCDSLEVEVSTDSGTTYTSVYNKICTDFATAPDVVNLFVPTSTQWRTEIIDLSLYNNTSNVKIRFKNIGGYGQPIYIDNIKVNTESPTLSLVNYEHGKHNLNLYPSPSSDYISVNNLTTTENYIIYNTIGATVNKGNISENEKIDIKHFTDGLYFLKFENGETLKFIKK